MSGFLGVGAGLEGSEETVACERSFCSALLGTCIERLLAAGAQAETLDTNPRTENRERKGGFLGFFLTVSRAILAPSRLDTPPTPVLPRPDLA